MIFLSNEYLVIPVRQIDFSIINKVRTCPTITQPSGMVI